MSTVIIEPSSLHGVMRLPPSKSQTIRAIVFAALARGKSIIIDPLFSPDTEAIVRAATAFGATVRVMPPTIVVEGIGGKVQGLKAERLDVGNSGLTLRFAAAIAAQSQDPLLITGDQSIQQLRPIGSLAEAIVQLGGKVTYLQREGFAPCIIQGPIHAGDVVMNGDDSQPVSALLLSLALMDGVSTVTVHNLRERPWVNLTVSWLRSFGITVLEDGDRFTVHGGGVIDGFTKQIPGDLSALAFPLAAALMTPSDILIEQVDLDDMQGDKIVVEYVKAMGARVEVTGKCLHVVGPQQLHGIDIDVDAAVDALPILAVLGTYASGTTQLSNAASCRWKESDRLYTMARSLSCMGADVLERPDGLIVTKSKLHGASLSSFNDHRIAMALTVAGMVAEGKTAVQHAECVEKSFPSFFSSLKALGAKVDRIMC